MFPVELVGDDVSAIVDEHRDQLPMHEHLVTMDPPDHTRKRALLMRLLTPKRLRENETFMWGLADRLLDEMLPAGAASSSGPTDSRSRCSWWRTCSASPRSTTRLREGFGLRGHRRASPGGWRAGAERRSVGSTHGLPNTSRTGGASRVVMCSPTSRWHVSRRLHPGREHRRADRNLPVRRGPGDDRPLARDGAEVPVGVPRAARRAPRPTATASRVHRRGATHREPGQGRLPARPRVDHRGRGRDHGGDAGHVAQRRGQPRPPAVRLPRGVPCRPAQRPAHIAFGRGATLVSRRPVRARREGRISLERILQRTRNIRLSDEHHGPADNRHFHYEPTWVLRGLHRDPHRVRRGRRVVHHVAVVTGGASGIGLGVAQRFAADGHRVAIFDRDGAAAETAAAAINANGGAASRRRSTSPTGHRSRIRRRPRQLGPVEILVTSAGVESFDPMLEITPEISNRVVAVDLTGTFTSCRRRSRTCWRRGGVGSSRSASSRAQSGAPNVTHYTASKGGVISLTEALAVEFARSGITANTIPPALVDTPMARNAEPV